MEKLINIPVVQTILKPLRSQSDAVGALASGLCMLHCLATPIFFIASTCSLSCCNNAPAWWQWIDYLFIGISFAAIKYATKSSTKNWVIQGLWISLASMFFLIINVKFEWFQLAANIKFVPAFILIALHTYNMRYCKCEEECC
tara:strand:- start:218 stop:646 length:429 start_codon:yes stop_codon:yes gene_type:complete